MLFLQRFDIAPHDWVAGPSYGGERRWDADAASQVCELAVCNDRPGGQPGRRTAWRFERYRESRVGNDTLDEIRGKVDVDRAARLDQTQRAWMVARCNQPQL